MSSGQPACIRLGMLKQLSAAAESLDIRIPEFCIIPHADIASLCLSEEGNGLVPFLEQALLDRTRYLASDEIFVRAQPLDESLVPHLSFAGVYPSYVPRKKTLRAENLTRGLKKVLSDRHIPYSDYYYSRHKIKSDRPVDVMFSSKIEDVMMFGTAYVFGDQCLIEYFDTPISIFLCDPVRIFARCEQRSIGISEKLIRSVFAVGQALSGALDIEFMVDRREQVFVSQVRPISPPHINNWKSVTERTWAEMRTDGPPSNVVNTVGTIAGRVVDFRNRKPRLRDFEGGQKIYVVSHRGEAQGTSSLDILQFLNWHDLSHVMLVVDHDEARVDDHLQYIMYEDPGVAFLAHSTAIPHDIDGRWWRVSSDGFRVTFDFPEE